MKPPTKLSLISNSPSETFSTPLSTGLGIPGLGLEIGGNAELGIDYDLDLKFGINTTNGFFFDTSTDNELNVNVDASVPGLSTTGELGFLQLDVTDDPDNNSNFNGSFTVDLQDSDNRVPFNTLPTVDVSELVAATLNGNTDVNLDLVTSFGGSAALPSLNSDFDLDWSFNSSTVDPDHFANFGDTPNIGFSNVQLDLGTFFSDFATPVLERVQTITQPVQPVIDVLTQDIDLAVASFNLLDIAEGLGVIDEDDQNFIESIAQLITNVGLDVGLKVRFVLAEIARTPMSSEV